jgi:hypothetical protein
MADTGFVPVFVATLLSVNYSLSGPIMLLPWAFPPARERSCSTAATSLIATDANNPPLPRRLAHSQMLPTPVELVKLRLHQTG